MSERIRELEQALQMRIAQVEELRATNARLHQKIERIEAQRQMLADHLRGVIKDERRAKRGGQ